MKKVAIIGHIGHGVNLQSAIDTILGKEKVEVLSKNNEEDSFSFRNKIEEALNTKSLQDDFLQFEPLPKFEETKFYDKPKSKYHK